MKFTLRDTMWLIVVISIALGWVRDHWQLARHADNLQAKAETWQANAETLAAALRDSGWRVNMSEEFIEMQNK